MSEVDAELEVVADTDVVAANVEVAVVSPVATAVLKVDVADAWLVAESVLSSATEVAERIVTLDKVRQAPYSTGRWWPRLGSM